MSQSITTFEDLPKEVLLEISDYLSINDCFNSFYNLNWSINSTLNLCDFSIDLTSIFRQTYNEFYKKIIFTHYRQTVRKLTLSNDLTLNLLDNFFNEIFLDDFEQLHSLTLIKASYMALSTLTLLISDLKQLRHLSITSNTYPENFLEKILNKSSSIISCYLPEYEIHETLSFQSNFIQYLTIAVEHVELLFSVLNEFPRLKYLHVLLRSSLDIDENSLPIRKIIPCENLQTLKLDISAESDIDFHEVEYIFLQTSLHNLKSFSYNCTTITLRHIDVNRWNKILTSYLSTIEKFQFFVQIQFNLNMFDDVKKLYDNMKTNLCYSYPLSLSINHFYYIIHTEIYLKKHFDLSFKAFEYDDDLNYDPISGDTTKKFSKVNSLVVNSNLITSFTILPKNIKHLQIQSDITNLNLDKCLKQCSKQLISLNAYGLPFDLLQMPKLRRLTIQKVMFKPHMVVKLSLLCPQLELLTVEIDSIEEFGDTLNKLRFNSNLNELKFLRAFSRDNSQTWTSWIKQSKHPALTNNIKFEARNLFLLIWL